MPPRYVYWTILIDQKPTAFRAKDREDLLATLHQLRRTNRDVVMKWFARGKLWESPDAERAAQQKPVFAEKRGQDWRPGGLHKDPRARFDKRKRTDRPLPRERTPAPDRPLPRERTPVPEGKPATPPPARVSAEPRRESPTAHRQGSGGPPKGFVRGPVDRASGQPRRSPPPRQPREGGPGDPRAAWRPSGPGSGRSKPFGEKTPRSRPDGSRPFRSGPPRPRRDPRK